MNRDPRPPKAVLKELREAKTYFAKVMREGRQTVASDSEVSRKVITPILHSENARTPGLNAVACGNEEELGKVLRKLSSESGPGKEGHVRFHLGVCDDIHRVAVDAFRHSDGGFTLVVVDSMRLPTFTTDALKQLSLRHPDLIKGTIVIPTPNLVHDEGCRIFAVQHLSALHDYQPYVQDLHREIHDKGRGLPAPRLSGTEWYKEKRGNAYVLANELDAFGVLPGKFFKHMQPGRIGPSRLFNLAEDRNPALKDQPVNKKGQILRQRFASQKPGTNFENFARVDKTLTLDKKRVALIDRAIEQYEGLAAQAASRPLPVRIADSIIRFLRSRFT
ncbi:MAG TPA: YopJ family acetyltransferase [Fibrobacteria bacterium]|nr:YopJ family acetyltransferase [Fibrobacteria bacterium]